MALRGSFPARLDDRNRLKVPADFRREVESTWGTQLFVTSFTGKDVQVYPLAVWEEFEARLMKLPLIQPARMRILKTAMFYGNQAEIDGQGRVLISGRLKDAAGLDGEVMVLGVGDSMLVQATDSLREDVTKSVEADLETLSSLWTKE